MGHRKISFTARYVLVFGLLLVAANILLGIVILQQTESSMKSLINKDMLDVTNTAAELLDGDALGALTEEDVDGEIFNDIKAKLSVFQNNTDIEFIYAVRQIDEDTFVFTVDPDPVEPGAFGEEIVVTEGIKKAGKGVAAVDDAPMADRWGNFYSAYSPVFDSAGNVAGIVGIDFSADWYNEQVWNHTITITAVTILSVVIGCVVIFIITNGVRKRFKQLGASLSRLSSSVDRLMEEVGTTSRSTPTEEIDAASGDEIERLGMKIQTMQSDMAVYLNYLKQQAHTDSLTRLGNSTAYHELVQKLESGIAQGTAEFTVIVFDVNSLKTMNDQFGHECGDRLISAAADAIAKGYGLEHSFRIGGDEFAVVKEKISEDEMAAVDAEIAEFNKKGTNCGMILAVSRGVAKFRPGEDRSFKEVFARADKTMYEEKKRYYQMTGDRRGC